MNLLLLIAATVCVILNLVVGFGALTVLSEEETSTNRHTAAIILLFLSMANVAAFIL